MEQKSLSMTGYFNKGKKRRREQFLTEMEQVVRTSSGVDRAALSEGQCGPGSWVSEWRRARRS